MRRLLLLAIIAGAFLVPSHAGADVICVPQNAAIEVCREKAGEDFWIVYASYDGGSVYLGQGRIGEGGFTAVLVCQSDCQHPYGLFWGSPGCYYRLGTPPPDNYCPVGLPTAPYLGDYIP